MGQYNYLIYTSYNMGWAYDVISNLISYTFFIFFNVQVLLNFDKTNKANSQPSEYFNKTKFTTAEIIL